MPAFAGMSGKEAKGLCFGFFRSLPLGREPRGGKLRTSRAPFGRSERSAQMYLYLCVKFGVRFSTKASMPSFWSSVANMDWKRRRSKRVPSARVVS